MMGPYLAPSAIIGMGEWGRAVAAQAESLLRERSPHLARACPVLTLADNETAPQELIRAHLRATRMAEVIRALEQAGLMQLDPLVSPPTYVYLVGSGDPATMARTSALVSTAAATLNASLVTVGLLDLPPDAPLPQRIPGMPLYVLEAATSHGLVLDPAEYQTAVAEALVAAVQPGGSAMLELRQGVAAGSVGTLGIAWLRWSPGALRADLARQLSRAAVSHALDTPAGRPAPVPVADGRARDLLEGLPFRAADLQPAHRLFGGPQTARRLPRCAAVLERRVARWQRRVERNAAARATREAGALEKAVESQPNLPVSRALADITAREATRRLGLLDQERTPPAPSPVPDALRRVEKANSLLDPAVVAGGLGAGFVLVLLVRWLAGGSWWVTLAWAVAFGLASLAYALWRPRRIQQTLAAAWAALDQHAATLIQSVVQAHHESLDRRLEEQATHLSHELDQAMVELRRHASMHTVSEPPQGGALSIPLLPAHAAESITHEHRGIIPQVAADLATHGVFSAWREPDRLFDLAQAVTADSLARSARLDPADLAARSYGERLAHRLQTAVGHLLHWSQPLLARHVPLPEGQQWLVWPEGLPCPPVPSGVQVLPASRGSAAAVTVIQSIRAGIPPQEERTSSL